MRHMPLSIIMLSIPLCLLSGCATAPGATYRVPSISTAPLPRPYGDGVYHVILKGQTLWKVAKAYNVDLKEIVDINRISDPSNIDVGQRIFIPGARESISGELIPQAASAKGYSWPTKGRVVSYFGASTDGVVNKGIDIAAGYGETVVASRAGNVVFCDDKVKGLGKTIIIDHGDGFSTLYAHNSEHLVKCGDHVKRGQPIAKVGETGRADRPKLHFQIRKGHEPQSPFYYLP